MELAINFSVDWLHLYTPLKWDFKKSLRASNGNTLITCKNTYVALHFV